MIERSKSIFDGTLKHGDVHVWNEEFVSQIIFSKYCIFDSFGFAINPKLGQKGFKLVFSVPMVIERWK